MKKLILSFVVLFFFTACNKKNIEPSTEPEISTLFYSKAGDCYHLTDCYLLRIEGLNNDGKKNGQGGLYIPIGELPTYNDATLKITVCPSCITENVYNKILKMHRTVFENRVREKEERMSNL